MQLYSQKIGQGFPLVILHGLFGMSDNWLGLGRRLAKKGFTVHLLDLRNHGESPHVSTHSYQSMSNDLLAYLDKEKLKEVFLVGHSMGGKVAMTFGLLHPKRLKKLVVIDIAPTDYGVDNLEYHANIIHTLMEIDLASYQDRREILTEVEHRLGDRTLTMFLGKSLMRDDLGEFSWKLNLSVLLRSLPAMSAGFGTLDEWAPSPVETLFLGGRNSDYILPEYDEKRMSFYPQSKVVWIDDAGHWLHIEQPDKVLRAISCFLADQ